MRMIALLLLLLSLYGISCFEFNTTNKSVFRRQLAATETVNGNQKDMKKMMRSAKTIEFIEKTPIPSHFIPTPQSPPHNVMGPAILAAAMGTHMDRFEAAMFMKTLRDTGFKGDVVLAVTPGADPPFLKVLKDYGAITYEVGLTCTGPSNDHKCTFTNSIDSSLPAVSINMIRYFLYQWMSRKYNHDAMLMISDFRDVFFQSNPFTYKTQDWAPPVAQFVAFQEPYPNKVIYRCAFNGGWIRECYGDEGLRKVGSNTVSCSGVSMGTRDAITIYSHLMTQHLDPRVRFGRNTTRVNGGCISLGMDQGFHNWLVYSGQLAKYVDLKIYQQGEGPVNTVGGFFGERIPIKFSLEKWQVLRGEKGKQVIYNWNNDPSPAIHQGDRFKGRDLGQDYENLAVTAAVRMAVYG